MSKLLFILIYIFGGAIGFWLENIKKIEAGVLYYLLGAIVGMISMALIIKIGG